MPTLTLKMRLYRPNAAKREQLCAARENFRQACAWYLGEMERLGTTHRAALHQAAYSAACTRFPDVPPAALQMALGKAAAALRSYEAVRARDKRAQPPSFCRPVPLLVRRDHYRLEIRDGGRGVLHVPALRGAGRLRLPLQICDRHLTQLRDAEAGHCTRGPLELWEDAHGHWWAAVWLNYPGQVADTDGSPNAALEEGKGQLLATGSHLSADPSPMTAVTNLPAAPQEPAATTSLHPAEGGQPDGRRGAQQPATPVAEQGDTSEQLATKDRTGADPASLWLGVDLGVARLAVLSHGVFLSGGLLRWRQRHWRERRAALQRTGRHARLRRTGGREQRWTRNLLHQVSRRIVQEAQEAGAGLGLERLTGFRQRVQGARRPARTRRMCHQEWAYRQLAAMVAYKAEVAGVAVRWVNPAHSSQTCPACGHCHPGNRPTRSRFRCEACGYDLDADLAAARNLAQRAVSLPRRGALTVLAG